MQAFDLLVLHTNKLVMTNGCEFEVTVSTLPDDIQPGMDVNA